MRDEIQGYIERITFQNEENGYTVAQLKSPKQQQLICVVGLMPGLKPGETVRCQGQWKNHLVHGKQFEVSQFKVEKPADVVGIKKYLGSGLIKGIGPIFAHRIVEKFGVDTLNIIDETPERLLEIEGLGKKKMGLIVQCWVDQRSIREVMVFLQTYGVSPAYAQKIYKTYGQESIQKVSENPYRLARDIFGIGFKMADTIAQKLGIQKESSYRLEAGLEFLLFQLGSEGHVCYPEEELIKNGETILEVEPPLLKKSVDTLVEESRFERLSLVHEGGLAPFVWAKSLYIAESGIVSEIKRLMRGTSLLRRVNTEKAIAWAEQKLKIELAPNQKKAVHQALCEKVQIITGGPGTGKSTITNAILTISFELTSRILLCAPTGRAAKRMSEITGRPAKTIHSLLEFNFKNGGFKRNRESPLDVDLIIVDEASMIDTQLMHSLLKAIPCTARVIFVGDIDQLPSVGPGNVLKDLIATRTLPVTTLTEIFRQAAGSRIITNAHRINRGDFPELESSPESDFFFIESEDPEKVLTQILALATARLPLKYQFNPFRDIQVLAPMRKGIIGTENLNLKLQEALNKNTSYLYRAGHRYACGDKVMQIRNNYDKEVFNGDIGTLLSIDEEEETAVIQFDEREVLYPLSDFDELTLAYAVSVHKYQGSEAPCIIMPVHTSHFKLLHRNLLYTGVTRGKKLVILVGNKKALALAVRNEEVLKRYTGLKTLMLGSS